MGRQVQHREYSQQYHSNCVLCKVYKYESSLCYTPETNVILHQLYFNSKEPYFPEII